jgi:hypothetical protein
VEVPKGKVHIEQKAASRRSPALQDQAQLFAMFTCDLVQSYARNERIEPNGFFALPPEHHWSRRYQKTSGNRAIPFRS